MITDQCTNGLTTLTTSHSVSLKSGASTSLSKKLSPAACQRPTGHNKIAGTTHRCMTANDRHLSKSMSLHETVLNQQYSRLR